MTSSIGRKTALVGRQFRLLRPGEWAARWSRPLICYNHSHCAPAPVRPAWCGSGEGRQVSRAVGRIILILLVAVTGAVTFHVYYRGLADTERCRWDHPFDQQAKRACKHAAAAEISGYSREARQELDRLIDKVSR
jgi:hypothetical protein